MKDVPMILPKRLILPVITERLDARDALIAHHPYASLLNMPHVVVAINKMDLVEFSQDVYNNIVIEYAAIAKSLMSAIYSAQRAYHTASVAGGNQCCNR